MMDKKRLYDVLVVVAALTTAGLTALLFWLALADTIGGGVSILIGAAFATVLDVTMWAAFFRLDDDDQTRAQFYGRVGIMLLFGAGSAATSTSAGMYILALEQSKIASVGLTVNSGTLNLFYGAGILAAALASNVLVAHKIFDALQSPEMRARLERQQSDQNAAEAARIARQKIAANMDALNIAILALADAEREWLHEKRRDSVPAFILARIKNEIDDPEQRAWFEREYLSGRQPSDFPPA